MRQPVVGLVGLGTMGLPVALRLLEAGFEVLGCRRNAVPEEFLAAGGRAGGDAAQVAREARVVITLLPTEGSLADVTAGLVSGATAATVVVEMSILPVAAKERARDALGAVGAVVLDAPISGTPAMVSAGRASIFCSGLPSKSALREGLPVDGMPLSGVHDVLTAITPSVQQVGGFGAGTQVKHVAHLLLAVNHLAAAEALSLARRAGLDLGRLLEVLSTSPASSQALLLRGPMMAAERFTPVTGAVGNLTEGLTQVQRFAAEQGAATPLLNAALEQYRAAAEAGHADEDVSVMVRALGRREQAPADR